MLLLLETIDILIQANDKQQDECPYDLAHRVADAYRCEDCVLVDKSIRQATIRDFHFEAIDDSALISSAKREEDLVVDMRTDSNPGITDSGRR